LIYLDKPELIKQKTNNNNRKNKTDRKDSIRIVEIDKKKKIITKRI